MKQVKRLMRCSWVVVFLFAASILNAKTWVGMFDFESGQTADITDVFQRATGFSDIRAVASLNIDGIEGDDWLFVDGIIEYACIEIATFQTLFYIDSIDFRHLFNLGEGSGIIAGFSPASPSHDHLIYRDSDEERWYSLDFSNYQFDRFTLLDLPGVFASGFSYSSHHDTGILFMDGTREWFYQAIESTDRFAIDWTDLFDATPTTVTECEIGSESSAFRFIIAVFDDAGQPTPTPGGEPTPTPTPTPSSGPLFYGIIAMGLAEELWGIENTNPDGNPKTISCGQSPNQIQVSTNEFFVVNSLSNSITVYDAQTLNLIPERSIGLGNGRNPFMMTQPVNQRSFVSNLIANTVSVVNLQTGAIIDEIGMPGGSDLPHDPGKTSWARPSGIVQIDNRIYVACANLGSDFTAAGPGIICRLDADNPNLIDWFESGGRNPMTLEHDVRYPDLLWIVHAGDYSSGFQNNGNISLYSISQAQIIETIEMYDAPLEIAFSSDYAYASSGSDGRVLRIDLDTFDLINPIDLPTYGQGLNFVSSLEISPDEMLWVTEFNHDQLYIINPNENDAIVFSRRVGDGPDAIAFTLR